LDEQESAEIEGDVSKLIEEEEAREEAERKEKAELKEGSNRNFRPS
jgi:hypothetical protein